MKKTIVLLGALALGSVAWGGPGDDDDYVWAPPTGVARGVVNIVTAPVEIVRGISYWGNVAYEDHPEGAGLDGAILGTVTGSLWTIARVVDGTLDCFTLGIWGNAVHSDFFPTFSWKNLWKPE